MSWPGSRALAILVTAEGGLPDSPSPVMVVSPRGWPADRIAALRRHAELGAVVVVVDPPADPAWADLVGADRGPVLAGAEVIVEATDDPIARNLAGTTVVQRDLTLLLPRAGTRTVLQTRLHLKQQAAVTAREVGAGTVVATAYTPVEGLSDDPVQAVVARLCRLGTPCASAVAGVASVGLGIIGYGQHGGMGWVHGTAASAVNGLHLAGVAEVHPQRLADAGTRFPDAVLHAEVTGLLADDGVDVVVVATPPSMHHMLALQSLGAGKHVVVEKPLCFTVAQADELLACAAESERLLTVHQNRRWDADYRALQRLVAEGRVGEVFNVETFVGGFEHPCTLWHSDHEISGGRLYDWGAHLIDQTLQLLGEESPAAVSAVGHKRVWHDVTNLDQVRVRMRFADGREAEFLDSDILAVRRPKYVVQGTRGTIVGTYSPVVEEGVTADAGYHRTEHHHAEGPARLTLAEHHSGWGLQTVEVPGLPAPAHPFHRALADHMQLGDPVPVDPAGVRTVTAVLEAASASARAGGRTIALS